MSRNPSKFSSTDSTQPELPPNWNYEATVSQVETILSRLESGELELEEVFNQFTEAVKYLHQCETFLQARQEQIDLVIERLGDEGDF